MFKSKFKLSIIFSVIIIILSVIVAGGGLFFPDVYHDNEIITTAFYGNDIVTLFLVVPMMIVALILCLRGSQKAQLVWMGTLWYMMYNYIFYLYGAAFNVFFLPYVALFTLSAYGLIFALIRVDSRKLAGYFSNNTPVKWISTYMFFFSGLLGFLWIAISLSFIFTGEVPVNIIETGKDTGIVFATDLSLLIPSLIVSGILLLKKNHWGPILSSIVLIKCVTYSLVLIAMSAIDYIRNRHTDPFILLWVILSIGCIISLWFLLKNMKDPKSETRTR
ncbi:hypothetical protein KHQ82_05550 [Mycoplasmatota bacterium]|nr:hypothetical protein KHQ82_05550 [Mycoplasmatota bacterium]